MHIKPFQAIYPKLEFIASSDSFFSTVKREYPEYKESGFFLKAEGEGFYVYKISTNRRSYTGLITCSDIQDYKNGLILKHENTLTALEQVQLHLLFRRHAAVKPVLLGYPKVTRIDDWLHKYIQDKEPYLDIFFESEEEHHLIWSVSDGEDIKTLQELFLDIPKAYIADGHHRTSTASLLFDKLKEKAPEKYRYFLTAYYSFSELEIFDFNRIVQGLNENSPTQFIARLSQVFEMELLEQPHLPQRKHELSMFFNREWYLLRWKPEILKRYRDTAVLLDASLLNEHVLDSILGIHDVRNDQRVKYIQGPKGIEGFREVVLRGDNRVGFLLYPVSLDDFIEVSDHHTVMPPKSTWFEPRMKNGVIVQEIG